MLHYHFHIAYSCTSSSQQQNRINWTKVTLNIKNFRKIMLMLFTGKICFHAVLNAIMCGICSKDYTSISKFLSSQLNHVGVMGSFCNYTSQSILSDAEKLLPSKQYFKWYSYYMQHLLIRLESTMNKLYQYLEIITLEICCMQTCIQFSNEATFLEIQK